MAKIFFSFLALLLTGNFVAYSQQNCVTFITGENLTPVCRSGSFHLNKKNFTIRYFAKRYSTKKEKFYSARIAVLDDPKDTLILSIGQQTENIPYFAPATGMAPYESGWYDTLFIDNLGHHYLYYESEENKRVNLISKTKKLLELEWTSNLPMDTPSKPLYLAIFIDNNLNQRVDKDELTIVTLTF